MTPEILAFPEEKCRIFTLIGVIRQLTEIRERSAAA